MIDEVRVVRRLFRGLAAVLTLAAVSGVQAAEPAYVETLPGGDISFEMVPIPAGRFRMGSPAGEKGRRDDEGPQREVEISAFWIGRHEVRWDEYRLFMSRSELARPAEAPPGIDAVARPTPPYVPMDFGMGVRGFPAIAMTQFAARQYTRWLSAATGRFYRLPTEAEWEYACRAGAESAMKKGRLRDHAWYAPTSGATYRRVGTLAPNAWGLHDILGNVAEWTLDAHHPYEPLSEPLRDPVVWPQEEWGRVVRGGSFRDDADALRCAARRASDSTWKRRDPQFPKSIWYLTDAPFVGLRVVRPVIAPVPADQERYWAPDVAATARILDEQN